MTSRRAPKVRIYHNHLWARYKGAIFSKVYASRGRFGLDLEFVQIAETSVERAHLGGADRSYHRYPFEVLFPGSYNEIPRFKLVLRLCADLLRHPSDLVVIPGYHRVEYWAMLVFCILVRRRRAVFCDSTAYDQPKSRWREIAKRLIFNGFDGVFCYGSRSRQYVASYGVDERQIFPDCQAAALPHDYDRAAVLADHEARPRRTAAAVRFAYVGRLAKEKGLEDLLEAFRLLRERLPEARLELAGSGVMLEGLKQRVGGLGLEGAVEFLGAKSPEEIGRLLLRSDAMVLPSHTEPWGLVVNEALSYGCPVVVSHISGCVPELVKDGVTGFSFPAGNVAALRDAMLAVAELGQERLALARQCLGVIEQYSPERAAEEILGGCLHVIKSQ